MRLRAHLNGGPEPPEEWVISRICEEFDCLPSEAVRELDDADADLLLTIMDMRAYARAKDVLDHAKSKADVTMTPAIQRVLEVEIEAMKLEAKRG